MSWTRLVATVTATVLVASATFASASDQEYGRSGPYAGGGGLYAFEDFSGDGSSGNPDDSWGFYLRGGYRFNEWFALELDFEDYVAFDEGGGGGDTNIWIVGINGKFYPFHGIIQPYFAAGGGFSGVDPSASTGEENDENAAFRFAGGLDVYVTRNWAFSADAGYYLPIGSISDFGAVPITFGVMYRFY